MPHILVEKLILEVESQTFSDFRPHTAPLTIFGNSGCALTLLQKNL